MIMKELGVLKEEEMTDEEKIKAKLIELGWTPPKNEPDNRYVRMPEINDIYYTLSSFGNIYSLMWSGGESDAGCRERGVVFRAEEEAKRYDEKLKTIADLWRCEGARDFVVGKLNFWPVYNNNHNEWD